MGCSVSNHHVRAPCRTIKKIVVMACGSLTFSLSLFEEKSPYRVGRHVENVKPKKGVNLEE